MSTDFPALYSQMYAKAKVRDSHLAEVTGTVGRILAFRPRYDLVNKALPTVPWWVVAVIHCLEEGLSFKGHLHNGDPLTARTVNEPKGLPKNGSPPFKWEDSAVDALRYDHLDKEADWSIGHALNTIERYNGMGYRLRGVLSPYLWSYTDQYQKGKFDSDGHYDPDLVSQEPGVAALLKELERRGAVSFAS